MGEENKNEISGAAKVCGILALIFAIISVLIPLVGTLFVTPLAIVFGVFALRGGSKGMGIATVIIVIINLLISPSFWANIYAGATSNQAGSNLFLTYFDFIGIVVMFFYIAKPRKKIVA